MKRQNMVKAASGRSVGTMWPAPCRKGAVVVSGARVLPQPSWHHPTLTAALVSSTPAHSPIPGSQPYLDSEESDVGEFLHEATDLVLAVLSVEPGPASHLHLGVAAVPSVPGAGPAHAPATASHST